MNEIKESVKFTPEEMSEFQELSRKYQDNLIRLGQLYINRLELEDKHNSLNEEEKKLKLEYATLQKLEDGLLAKVTAKYGEGSLDPASGVFTPVSK